nr:hypothetical protein [Streptomyces sp. NBRC 110028]
MSRQDAGTDATVTADAPSEIAIAVDRLVTNGLKALADYDALTQEQVDHIVKKASVAALDQHTALARLAVDETGRGVFEDKAAKNMFAREHVTHSGSARAATTCSGSRCRRRSTSSRSPSATWPRCRTSTGSRSSPTRL